MIAAYQRISRADGDLGKDGKDKSNSIENQKELILRYISCKESLQNVPVMDFVDDGYTGSNFDRPGFQQMMDGVRNGKIDTIIVKDLSRFGRDYIGVGEYMEQIFPLLGVRLIAINDNYDSNNYKGTTLGMDVIVSNLVNAGMQERNCGLPIRLSGARVLQRHLLHRSAISLTRTKRAHLSLTRQPQKSFGVFSTLRFWGWEQEI